MQDILDKLNRVRGVGGSLLISPDGLPMASALRQGSDETQISAAVGGLLENATRLSAQLNLGRPKSMQTLAGSGGILMVPAGPGWLTIVIDPAANLALLQLEARPFAERIAQRLSL